ncbi:MAG: hypothetical protein IJY19_04415 [Ruminococcus sp.]|nr:hypothetical protein [Ruminococcus sp.]
MKKLIKGAALIAILLVLFGQNGNRKLRFPSFSRIIECASDIASSISDLLHEIRFEET